MLKKEFRDAFRILLESSMLMLSIPVFIILSNIFGFEAPPREVVPTLFILTVFAFAGYSGIALFRSEKRDKGFEYLFSLPMSRAKILVFKLIPRFTILLILSVAVVVFCGVTVKGTMVPLLFLHLGSVCISLAFESYFAGFITLVLLGFFYSLSSRFISMGLFLLGGRSFSLYRYISPNAAALLVLGIPLIISFWLVLKNLDLKPYKYTIKPYFTITLPVIVLHIVVFLIFYKDVSRWS